MMPTLTPDIDAYGTYARHSALADYLELQSLVGGRSISQAKLADVIRDNDWHRKLRPNQIYDGSVWSDDLDRTDLAAEVDFASEIAMRIFDVLRERSATLRDFYPFKVDVTGVTSTKRCAQSGYIQLLALTLCHAYGLQASADPRRCLEEIVTRVLRRRGFLATNLASIRRRCSSFQDSIKQLQDPCALTVTPELGIYRAMAQEEGVDVVAHLTWDDPRPVHWVVIAQVTCAKSDRWRAKLNEPAPQQWMKILGLTVAPLPLFVVPHHIPAEVLSLLTNWSSGTRFILDRLRLAPFLDVTKDEANAFWNPVTQATLEI